MKKITNRLTFLFLLGVLMGCNDDSTKLHKLSDKKTEAELFLEQRNQEFTPQIIKIASKVYTAVGYDVSTVSMIVGDDGYILIDAGMLPKNVTLIKKEFEKITDLPLKAIIYTHSHGDHTRGTSVFLSGTENVAIWSRSNFGVESEFNKLAHLHLGHRGVRQAGFALPMDKRINNGIAPAVAAPVPKKGDGKKIVFVSNNKPTNTFDGDLKVLTISGVTLELHAAPGETEDQLYVWYPDQKVLFAGDNFYKSWPNLYAIRGTLYRNVRTWIESLASMLEKKPEVLVGGHTQPIVGQAEVTEVLGNYHGAIKFVFEKTIEGINKGMTPDQLVEYVQLPEKYAKLDYLHGYYGRVDWSVRQIFNGYLGWFDGNATNLIPLRKKEEAEKMIALMGGNVVVVKEIKKALNNGDYQWAAQLSDYILTLLPEHAAYKELKALAMVGLGRNIDNALARNYYLTTAQELRK